MKPVNFNLSKELSDVAKEKGIELPESDKYWIGDDNTEPSLADNNLLDMFDFHCNAYSCDELFPIFPERIAFAGNYYEFIFNFTRSYDGDTKYYASYMENEEPFCEHGFEYSSNPANALAKLAIWLIKDYPESLIK